MEYMPTQNQVLEAMENSNKLIVKSRLEDLKQAILEDNEGLIIALVIQHEYLLKGGN